MTRSTAAQPSVDVLRFGLLDAVCHGISSRVGGVSPAPYATLNMGLSTGDAEQNVLENRRRFARSLGISPSDLTVTRLRHGRDVTVLRSDTPRTADEGEFASDAAITDRPGTYLFLTFADCVPIIFVDRRLGIVGAAHAGWRGTALGIAPAVVCRMCSEFGSRPRDIAVGVGPSIGPCCYDVGPDVLHEFRASGSFAAVSRTGGRTRLDLWETTERQLRAVGVDQRSIENPRICTSCHVSRFFSHRAEGGNTGRSALCAGIS